MREAHLALRTEGVTFTVYSDNEEGIERVWPFDLLPRIIPAAEWAPIEAGPEAARARAQPVPRATSTTSSASCKDGVVPAELIFDGKDFRREIMGIDPPQGIYTHISGIDLVRDATAATWCSRTTCARRPASRT